MFKTLFACATLLAASADAHSMMTLPKPNSQINNSPSGTIDGPKTLTVPEGMSFGYGPEQNTQAFHKAFKAQTKYKSIRDIVYAGFKPDGASTKECGQSAMTGPPQELPEYVEYAGGLDRSHEGPCEVWCDDTRVFYEENCSVKYTEKPAKLPYDKSKCVGAKRLQSIWLALHVPDWQAYISCATLSGGSGGGSAPAPAPSNGGNSNNGGNNGGNNNNNNGGNSNNNKGNGGNNGGNNNNKGGNGGNNNNKPAPTPAPVTNKPAPAGGKCTKRARRN